MTADVDVLLPVRNGGRLLGRAIESVLAQDGPSIRVIVIDDGSTDGATRRLRDSRITTMRSPGRGLPAALNAGLAAATAPVVARQDADDESLQGRLAAQLDYLDAHPGIALVATAYEVVIGRRIVGTRQPALRHLLDDNPICHGTVAVRRTVLTAVGGYRQQFRSAEDYDCWLRCLAVSGAAVLPVVGYRYRIRGDQASIRDNGLQEVYAALAKASARARLAGAPDPVDEWAEPEPVAPADDFTAWWAREFAALGCWTDSLRCLRRLPPRRAALELRSLIRGRQPQVMWSD